MFIRSAAIQFEKRYGGAVLNCDDYEQEGRIALLHAAERFVPEKGKFLTYAAVVVCTAMLDALRQTHPEINTVSLEENQAAVEAMQSDNPALSRDIYHKSPEQLYLNKEKLLALYDAMNRSSRCRMGSLSVWFRWRTVRTGSGGEGLRVQHQPGKAHRR